MSNNYVKNRLGHTNRLAYKATTQAKNFMDHLKQKNNIEKDIQEVIRKGKELRFEKGQKGRKSKKRHKGKYIPVFDNKAEENSKGDIARDKSN